MNDTPPDVSTGFLAFVAFVFLALALWFLMRNMNARMRRMSYRQQRAHRGKDDPQAGPEEVDGDVGSGDAGPAAGGSGSGGPGSAGPSGSGSGG